MIKTLLTFAMAAATLYFAYGVYDAGSICASKGGVYVQSLGAIPPFVCIKAARV